MVRFAVGICAAGILLGACQPSAESRRPESRGLDSTALVARARVAMDSVRGLADTLAITVRDFNIDTGIVTIVMVPSSLMQGGGGFVQLDTTGRVLFARLYQ